MGRQSARKPSIRCCSTNITDDKTNRRVKLGAQRNGARGDSENHPPLCPGRGRGEAGNGLNEQANGPMCFVSVSGEPSVLALWTWRYKLIPHPNSSMQTFTRTFIIFAAIVQVHFFVPICLRSGISWWKRNISGDPHLTVTADTYTVTDI